jgi:hypothetical protein
MMLAGIAVSDRYVLELASRLRDAGYDHTAERFETAQQRQTKLLGLSIEDREVILSVLVDPPEQLAELGGVLLQEHEWRQREGL